MAAPGSCSAWCEVRKGRVMVEEQLPEFIELFLQNRLCLGAFYNLLRLV